MPNIWKKFLSVTMALVLAAALVGCGGSPASKEPDSNPGGTTDSTGAAATSSGKKFKVGWSCHYWNAYNTVY